MVEGEHVQRALALRQLAGQVDRRQLAGVVVMVEGEQVQRLRALALRYVAGVVVVEGEQMQRLRPWSCATSRG